MSGLGAQRGQATVEWVGLLLGVALMLGALVAGGREAAKGESSAGLGEAVAERITCAARGACGSRLAGDRGGAGGVLLGQRPPRRPSLRRTAPRRQGDVSAGTRLLRGAEGATKHAWLLCFGYKRWKYEREHPLTPRQGVPLRVTAKMINDCVNPLSFLFG
jgi:hypothetical protein